MEDFFNIYLFGVDDAKRVAEELNEAHVHDYEELLIGLEGQLDHFIDFRSETIDAPYVSFITAGKIHRLKPLEKDGHCNIWVLRFKSDFIAETSFQLYSSFHDNANMCMKLDGCFGRLNTLCSMIYDEYTRGDADMAVIKQLLISLICIIESEKRKDSTASEDNKNVQNHTFKSFLQVLEKHYREPRNVDFYAEKLFMTSRNLNLICQRILHQSVSEIVETRKLLEAKNMLITTDKTVAEIGFDLGFNEKTYFTHVFKKKAGISPSDFRKEMRAKI
ncbi:MAG: helix-turn-helix domain-containing protein [Bacteroidaceae bacterium]|jgi:AraC-like DNA-binding protein|nr:helix-turn-helix domain-containing protein [Bacteroidaceae bacterium]